MYAIFDNTKFYFLFFSISIYLFLCIPFVSGDPIVASNGYITQLDISDSNKITTNWQGLYGIIQNGYFVDFNLTGNMSNISQLNITSPSNIEYLLFSNSTLDSLSGFSPGNVTQLDHMLGSTSDNATNTFNSKSNFTLAGVTIYDVPTAYTHVNGNQQNSYFREGFLIKGSTFVFITEVKNNIGFNNISQDYQVILPLAPPSLNIYFVYVSMFEETKKISGEIKTNGESLGDNSCANGVIIKEEINNIQFYEIGERYLQKNVTILYFFTTPDLAIYEIITTPRQTFGSICIRNEQLKDLSKIKDLTMPEGIIYEYVDLNAGIWEFSNPGISDTVIKFRIKKDWLNSNILEDSSIVLQRWNGSKWILLETEKNNTDETFIYYEATTDAFGPFAISSIHRSGSPTTIPTITIEPLLKKNLPSFLWWHFAVAILIIITLLYYFKYSKQH